MKIIAVSGIARSGKDTFANKLRDVISENHPNLRVSRESFASFLKDEMRDFVLEKFNKDIYSLDGEDKELLRPLLVAYGFAKRQQTQGRYFVDLLAKKMQIESNDICIISDLRYADKESDELHWLKNEVNGRLVHVSRYDLKDGKKSFFKAPNEDEKRNDPLLKKASDFQVCWQTANSPEELEKIARQKSEEFYYQNISLFL